MSRVGPKWADPNRKRTKRSQKHERRLAREAGGKTTPASGAVPFTNREIGSASVGGDFANDSFLFEHKSTENASLGLKLEWLRKVAKAADRKMLDPALVVTFTDTRNRPIQEWVAVPKDVFFRLTGIEVEGR